MGCGKKAWAEEVEEENLKARIKMLDNLTTAQKSLIIDSAYYVVHVFEEPSSLVRQAAAIQMLKDHLDKNTRY